MWFLRKSFWNVIAWFKVAVNKPMDIPLPAKTLQMIKPVPLAEAIPDIPIQKVLVCHPKEIPTDEKSAAKTFVYKETPPAPPQPIGGPAGGLANPAAVGPADPDAPAGGNPAKLGSRGGSPE